MIIGRNIKDISSLIFIVIALFVVKISTISPSPIENDEAKFMLLTAQINYLETKMDQLLNQVVQDNIIKDHFIAKNSELETKIIQLVDDQNKRLDHLQMEFETKIQQLITENVKQEKEIRLLKDGHDDIVASAHDPKKKSINIVSNEDGIKADSSPRLPPSSCRQLSTIGHYLDGIYLVANPDTNKIETVYCDFGSSTLSETLFGSVDVKSKSVYFYVQRDSEFSSNDVVLPFEIELVNVGGAMNVAKGVFTVPVDGIYHFEFSALKSPTADGNVYVYLQVNGLKVANSFAPDIPYEFQALSSINAYLRLNAGDQVNLYKTTGTLRDGGNRYTHFSGQLVEENILLG